MFGLFVVIDFTEKEIVEIVFGALELIVVIDALEQKVFAVFGDAEDHIFFALLVLCIGKCIIKFFVDRAFGKKNKVALFARLFVNQRKTGASSVSSGAFTFSFSRLSCISILSQLLFVLLL